MTAYFPGALAFGSVIIATIVTGVALARLLVPDWSGSWAGLASLVCGLTGLVVEAEMLGFAQILSRWPLIATSITVAALLWLIQARAGGGIHRGDEPADARPPAASRLIARGLAVVGLAAWAAQSLADMRNAARYGVQSVDALYYHLSAAAVFLQSHSTTVVHQFATSDVSAYYPFNDELLQAVSMATLGHDTFALVISALNTAAAFWAAWVIGRSFDAGAECVAAIAPLAIFLGPSVAASAGTDWAGTWPVLAGVAFLIHARSKKSAIAKGELALIGMSAGLALGAKTSALVPAIVLVIVAVAIAGEGRFVGALSAITGLVVAGSFWYVKDLVDVASPLPGTKLPFFETMRLPMFYPQTHSILSYATNSKIINDFFRPGLHQMMGPLWMVVWLAVLAAGVVALIRGDAVIRAIGALVLIGVVGYLAGPTSAAGPPGDPILFRINIRYAWPAIAPALCLTVVLWRALWVRVAVAAVAIVITMISFAKVTAFVPGEDHFGARVFAGLLVVAAAAALAWRVVGSREHLAGAVGLLRRPVTAGAVIAVLALVVGYPVQRSYLDHRYKSGTPINQFFAVAGPATGARYAITGFPLQYPLYDTALTNTVQYLGMPGPHHSFVDFSHCSAYVNALQRGRFDDVFVEQRPTDSSPPPELAWSVKDSAAKEIFHNSVGAVFRLNRDADAHCG